MEKREIEGCLKYIEKNIDAINPDYGSREEYCIFCKSINYNSKLGVVHIYKCPLFQLRAIIRTLEIEREKEKEIQQKKQEK